MSFLTSRLIIGNIHYSLAYSAAEEDGDYYQLQNELINLTLGRDHHTL